MGPFGYRAVSRQIFGDIQETQFSGSGSPRSSGKCSGFPWRNWKPNDHVWHNLSFSSHPSRNPTWRIFWKILCFLRKSVLALAAECEWSAAAAGQEPLRMPRARISGALSMLGVKTSQQP